MSSLVPPRRTFRKNVLLAASIALGVLCIETVLLATHWPFTRAQVTDALQHASASEVLYGGFKMKFLPEPGCEAWYVSFVRQAAGQNVTLATAHKLSVRGSWRALLKLEHRVNELRVDHLNIDLPANIPPRIEADPHKHPATIVNHLIADGAMMRIAGHTPEPLLLQFKTLQLDNVGKLQQIRFRASFHGSEPAGDVQTSGSFGPWNSARPEDTPINGSFRLIGADLSRYRGIAGALSAEGSFHQTLGNMEVSGAANSSNFEVTKGHHPVALAVTYSAVSNALNGNTVLKHVEANFLHTQIRAKGNITDNGKTQPNSVSLDLNSTRARVEDLLYLFVKAPRPPMQGVIALHASAAFPARTHQFLEDLRLNGHFDIERAIFTSAKTRQKLNELSARARNGQDKNDPEAVTSNLSSDVATREAMARLSNLRFAVPGATAQGRGIYNLRSLRSDIEGMVTIEASLSHAVGGIKSLLLKPFNPLFRPRNRNSGAVLAVHITGKYGHPAVTMSPAVRDRSPNGTKVN